MRYVSGTGDRWTNDLLRAEICIVCEFVYHWLKHSVSRAGGAIAGRVLYRGLSASVILRAEIYIVCEFVYQELFVSRARGAVAGFPGLFCVLEDGISLHPLVF